MSLYLLNVKKLGDLLRARKLAIRVRKFLVRFEMSDPVTVTVVRLYSKGSLRNLTYLSYLDLDLNCFMIETKLVQRYSQKREASRYFLSMRVCLVRSFMAKIFVVLN